MRKRNISRRDFLRAASLAAAGGLMAACTPQATSAPPVEPAKPTEAPKPADTKAPEVPTPTQAPPPPENVKITIWGWWADRMKLFEDAGKKFTAKNPNITVEVISFDKDFWTKVYAAVPASTGPTLCKMITDNYFKMRDSKLILTLDELSFPKADLKKKFPNHAWDSYGTYVVPEGNQPAIMVYNKEMFQKANLDPEKAPKTWVEFVDAAKKLTQVDKQGAITIEGVAFDDWLPNLNLLYQQGIMVVKNDGGGLKANFDTPEMGTTYQFFQDAAFKEKYWSKDFPYFSDAIGTEKAAIILGESWAVGTIKTSYPDVYKKLGFAAPPTPTGEAKPYYGRMNSVLGLASVINRPDTEIEAGRKFLAYLYNEDLDSQFAISSISGLTPAHADNLKRQEVVNDPYYTLAAELVSKEHDTVDIGGGFSDIFYKAMDMLIVNKDTIQNVLAFGQSELQGLIDKGNIKYTL